MRYVYPVKLTREDGEVVAATRDIPEAITGGATDKEALSSMGDALGAALAGYLLENRNIPAPTDPLPGEYLVPVTALVAAKLALISAMREQGISKSDLARRMKLSEGAVRRLVDPDHASRIDSVVGALTILGTGIIIEDQRQSAA